MSFGFGFDAVDKAFARKSTLMRLECIDCGKAGDDVETRSVLHEIEKANVVDYPLCLACWKARIYGDERIDPA